MLGCQFQRKQGRGDPGWRLRERTVIGHLPSPGSQTTDKQSSRDTFVLAGHQEGKPRVSFSGPVYKTLPIKVSFCSNTIFNWSLGRGWGEAGLGNYKHENADIVQGSSALEPQVEERNFRKSITFAGGRDLIN